MSGSFQIRKLDWGKFTSEDEYENLKKKRMYQLNLDLLSIKSIDWSVS